MFFTILLFFGVYVSLAFSATIEKCSHEIELSLAGVDASAYPCDGWEKGTNACDLLLRVEDGDGRTICEKRGPQGDDKPKITDEDGSPWQCGFKFEANRYASKGEFVSLAKFYIIDEDSSSGDDTVCMIDLRYYWGYAYNRVDLRKLWNNNKGCLAKENPNLFNKWRKYWTLLTEFKFLSIATCGVDTTTTDAKTSLTTGWIAKTTSTDVTTLENTPMITEVSTTATDVMVTSTIKETTAVSMLTLENKLTVEETSTDAGIPLEGTAYKNQGVMPAKTLLISVCLIGFLMLTVVLSYILYMRLYKRKL